MDIIAARHCGSSEGRSSMTDRPKLPDLPTFCAGPFSVSGDMISRNNLTGRGAAGANNRAERPRQRRDAMTIIRVPSWGLTYSPAEYYGFRHGLQIGPWLVFLGRLTP